MHILKNMQRCVRRFRLHINSEYGLNRNIDYIKRLLNQSKNSPYPLDYIWTFLTNHII